MEIKIETEWITTEKFAGEQLRAIVRGTYTNTNDDNATAVFVEFKNGARTGKKGNNFAAYRISDFLDTFERVKRVNEIDDHRFPMMFTVDIWGYVSCRSINVEQDSGPYDVLAARAKISVVNGKLVFETLPTNPTQTKRTKQ